MYRRPSTVMTRQSVTVTLPDLRAVQGAARNLGDALVEAGPDDGRWSTVGPVVTAAADRLREALGVPLRGSCVGAPPIVRECDFGSAARRLLARDARVVDPQAARDFVRLALEATVALS